MRIIWYTLGLWYTLETCTGLGLFFILGFFLGGGVFLFLFVWRRRSMLLFVCLKTIRCNALVFLCKYVVKFDWAMNQTVN